MSDRPVLRLDEPGLDALAVAGVGLGDGPVPVVQGNLVSGVCLKRVGLQVVVAAKSQPVAGAVCARQEPLGQLGGEVVLGKRIHGRKVGAIPLAQLGSFLARVAHIE